MNRAIAVVEKGTQSSHALFLWEVSSPSLEKLNIYQEGQMKGVLG